MKVTKRQLKQIIKEELEAALEEARLPAWERPGNVTPVEDLKTSEDVMARLEDLGWSEELQSAVGTPAGAYGDDTDPATRAAQEEEYDKLVSNPEIQDLLKQYAATKKAEYRARARHPVRQKGTPRRTTFVAADVPE